MASLVNATINMLLSTISILYTSSEPFNPAVGSESERMMISSFNVVRRNLLYSLLHSDSDTGGNADDLSVLELKSLLLETLAFVYF
jgi:hypothetical protein